MKTILLITLLTLTGCTTLKDTLSGVSGIAFEANILNIPISFSLGITREKEDGIEEDQ